MVLAWHGMAWYWHGMEQQQQRVGDQHEQQQHRGWLQSVLRQARGGADRHRHRRSKRLAADPKLALELPTFFRSASSSSSSEAAAAAAAAAAQQKPLRWLDRHRIRGEMV